MAKIEVELIDHMGDDLTVVNAARVSFDKESDLVIVAEGKHPDVPPILGLSGKDERLISYLAKHNHFTPFTHPQITLRETVPIFVARQRFKHMVGFTYNEVSRRYVDDEPELFDLVHRAKPDGSVKQGSADREAFYQPLVQLGGKGFKIEEVQEAIVEWYNRAVSDEFNIATETARGELPQKMMTSYYVTGSLAAFARMVKQRKDSHAQKEIQDLAQLVDDIIRPLYPVSWSSLVDD